jgi:dCTP deaminase
MSAGVMNQQQVQESLLSPDGKGIKSREKIVDLPDPSSIDLPLGHSYYVMKASSRPTKKSSVSDLIQAHGGTEQELTEETVFERDKVYLVKLAWDLDLPPYIYARSTAKSSIGRLDVLVRLVSDGQPEFDRITAEVGRTQLYVEVVPITFNLKVKPGLKLSQMRFIIGTEELCTIPAAALEYEDIPFLINKDGRASEYRKAEGDLNAVLLSLELAPDDELGFAGFVAKSDRTEAIDPSMRRISDDNDPRYNPTDFWDPVAVEDGRVKIEKNRFYIFRSKERFRVPPNIAVECQAYSESLGDIRIHYAGFAHPYFGYDRDNGTPLIFEVRGHNMDTILRDGDALAKVYCRRMSHIAQKDVKPQEYNRQELKLSGCFKDWPK